MHYQIIVYCRTRNNVLQYYKTHVPLPPSEYDVPPDECRLWRLSFSSAEKEIMTHADSKYKKEKNIPTCRKDVLRLLKLDLQIIVQNDHKLQTLHFYSSYHIKISALHMFNNWKLDEEWRERRLAERYVGSLNFILQSLTDYDLEHYFLPGVNMLSDMRMLTGAQQEAERLRQGFTKRLDLAKSFV